MFMQNFSSFLSIEIATAGVSEEYGFGRFSDIPRYFSKLHDIYQWCIQNLVKNLR